MLIIGYGSITAQAIATEKSSRVMELLLTSVRPLAVIIGKVVASILVVLSSVVLMGGISTIVFFAVAPFGTIGEVIGTTDTVDPVIMGINAELGNAFAGFTPLNILFTFIVFMLGFLFYSLISGLIGASVSKIEDLQTASQPINLIAALGMYLAYFPAIFGAEADSTVVMLSYYLPISSPFALPAGLLKGDVSSLQALGSIAVLAVLLVVFALFVAKVYEHIILHNGDRIKLKDMMTMIKNAKAAKSNA
jgi:ABC-2 type transport system permease protein